MTKTARRRVRRTTREALARRILDAALGLAETGGWSALRLRQVAERLDIPPADLRALYRDRDAVADAWFDRADAAMLENRPPDFAALPVRERLHIAIMAWLDAMAGHRRVTGEMLADKLWPFHPHHNIGLVLRLSRTVQWIREAALLDAGGRWRQIEEIGLSGLLVATVRRWLRDEGTDQAATREWLTRRLDRADRLMASLAGPRPRVPGYAGITPSASPDSNEV